MLRKVTLMMLLAVCVGGSGVSAMDTVSDAPEGIKVRFTLWEQKSLKPNCSIVSGAIIHSVVGPLFMDETSFEIINGINEKYSSDSDKKKNESNLIHDYFVEVNVKDEFRTYYRCTKTKAGKFIITYKDGEKYLVWFNSNPSGCELLRIPNNSI